MAAKIWYFSDMSHFASPAPPVPAWNLYGEAQPFPDVLHIEDITDRAKGLDWTIAPHRHKQLHQFFLIHAGQTVLTVDGKTLRPDPPFLLSIPPGAVHGFVFAAGTDGQVLSIPSPNMPAGCEGAAGICHDAGAITATSRIFADIKQEFITDFPARPDMLKALAAQVAVHFLRAESRGGGGQSTPSARAISPHFLRFQSLLQGHLRAGWRVADYAAALHISERHLSRICLAASNLPASALIDMATHKEACRLLAYTRKSVSSIGYELGFDDPSYFSRAFKRAIGQSPAAYRMGFDRS